MHAAPLAVGLGPQRLDRVRDSRRAVRDDHQRAAQAAPHEAATERGPVLLRLAHPQADVDKNPLAAFIDAPAIEHALLAPIGLTGR